MAKLKKYLSGYKRPPLTALPQQRTFNAKRAFGGGPDFMLTAADVAYVNWLAKERGTTLVDSYNYAISEPRGRILSQTTNFLDVKTAKMSSGKKWKANYIWYRPPVFTAKTLGQRSPSEQLARYREFYDGRSTDFQRAA